MKNNKNRSIQGYLRPFYRWHRRIGMAAVIFIVILSITGILLNHNASLGLNKSNITNNFLLKIYNIQPDEKSDFGYPTDILTADQVILDIHTGRFFGKLGPLVMDLVAISLLILCTTGTYMWFKKPKPSRKKKT